MFGTATTGMGVEGAVIAGTRNAPIIGATYSVNSTARLTLTHA